MSRIASCFQQLQQQQKAALIPFVTAGDPAPSYTVSIMHELVKGGADVIELGMPFSDPMADGPVIQRASERALEAGTRLTDVLGIVAEFRQSNQQTPVVLMGYLNPLENMGYAAFSAKASQAGVDGVLIVDLPPEEAKNVKPILQQQELDLIFLLSPTTPAERIDQVVAQASGYLYYVSLKGVTGSKALDTKAVAEKVAEIRTHTDLPIGVGFGIRDAESAAQVAQVSDAVVVGSALVQQVETVAAEELATTLGEFLSGLRIAMDRAREEKIAA